MKNINKSYMTCVLAPRLAGRRRLRAPMCLLRVSAGQPTRRLQESCWWGERGLPGLSVGQPQSGRLRGGREEEWPAGSESAPSNYSILLHQK